MGLEGANGNDLFPLSGKMNAKELERVMMGGVDYFISLFTHDIVKFQLFFNVAFVVVDAGL
jgi:hypothetical protein